MCLGQPNFDIAVVQIHLEYLFSFLHFFGLHNQLVLTPLPVNNILSKI